jgi:hypothetical protein
MQLLLQDDNLNLNKKKGTSLSWESAVVGADVRAMFIERWYFSNAAP